MHSSRSLAAALAAAALLSPAQSDAFGQADATSPKGLSFQFMAGWQATDIGALNDELAERDIPTFRNEFVTLGGAGTIWLGSWILGLEFHALLPRDRSTAAFERSLTAGLLLLDVGRGFRLGDLRIEPLAGIGGGEFTLEATPRDAVSFDELLDDPSHSSELSQTHFLVQAALRLDYLVEIAAQADTARGFRFGVQVGYLVDFAHQDWRLTRGDVFGGPDIAIGRGYIRVCVGVWDEWR